MSCTVPIVNKLFSCCIKDCDSRHTMVLLHQMPVNRKRLQKWVECIDSDELRRLTLDDISKLYVCHKHFEKRFITDKFRLLTSAYPSLFSANETFSGKPTKNYKDENLNPNANHPYVHLDHDHSYCNSNLSQDISKRFSVSDFKMSLPSNTIIETNKCTRKFYNTDRNKLSIETTKIQRSGHSQKSSRTAAKVRSEIMSVKHRWSSFLTDADTMAPISVDADEVVIKCEDIDGTCNDDVQEVNKSQIYENVQMLENDQVQGSISSIQGHRTFIIGEKQNVLCDAQIEEITSYVQRQDAFIIPQMQKVVNNAQVLRIARNDLGQNVIIVQKQNVDKSAQVQGIASNVQVQEGDCNSQQKQKNVPSVVSTKLAYVQQGIKCNRLSQHTDPIPATQDRTAASVEPFYSHIYSETNKEGYWICLPTGTQAKSASNIMCLPQSAVDQSDNQVRTYSKVTNAACPSSTVETNSTETDAAQPKLTVNPIKPKKPIKPMKNKPKCRNCIRAKQRRKTHKVTKKDYFDKFTAKLHSAAKQFIWMQIRNATRKNKGRRFTLDEKLLSIAIFEQSDKCYKFLRKIFLLPSRSSLKKCLKDHCAVIDASDPQASEQAQDVHDEVNTGVLHHQDTTSTPAGTSEEQIDFAMLDEFPPVCFQDEMGSSNVYQTLELS